MGRVPYEFTMEIYHGIYHGIYHMIGLVQGKILTRNHGIFRFSYMNYEAFRLRFPFNQSIEYYDRETLYHIYIIYQ